ncbi:MAG TPA: DUF6580 family putative transport protein [Terriglobales bacterium]|nr:DUF6580 family putative transport protein [Terriglobales bacterium]
MLAYVLILAVIAARLLLRPLAFAPVMPVLLLAGARLPRKMFWLPVALLTAADLYLTFAVYGAGFKADQFIVSAWYLAMLFLGSALLKDGGKLRILVSALAGSASFFILSNFAVWAVWPTYPKTIPGLAACYVAAIPFFRNQFVSDMVFTAVIFAIPMALEAFRPERAPVKAA